MTTMINEAEERFGHHSREYLIELAEKQRRDLKEARGKLGAKTVEMSRQHLRLSAERKARIRHVNSFLEHMGLAPLGPYATSEELDTQEDFIRKQFLMTAELTN